MRVLSLFDGISCGMVALERARIPIERYYAYEIEPNAIKISKKNYPDIIQLGDVFDTDFCQFAIQNIDLLIGGSPCTFWSKAKCHTAKQARELDTDGVGWKLFLLLGKGHFSQVYRLYYLNGKAPTLVRCRTETKTNILIDENDICKYKIISPIEAERLQTLPDNYTEGVPKTRRFEAIANGWTVDVIAHILSFIPSVALRQ